MTNTIKLRIAALAIAAASVGPLAATPSLAATLDFSVINEGNSAVTYIFVSPAGYDSWGPDQLGSNVLMPGEHLPLSITTDYAGCYFDMRIVDELGRETLRWNQDVCAYESITLH